jgi:hypothetical protein
MKSTEMIRLVASCSIECLQFNSNANFKWYECVPRNGAPLFLNDLTKDMQHPLPCKQDFKPLEAKEILLNGSLYYLTDDKRAFMQATDEEYNEI